MDEALRMRGRRRVQARLTRDDELVDATVEYVGRGEQHQARVLMMMVLPVEEFGAPGPCMLHCHLGLGKLYGKTNQREQAREHLATATAMYREMAMEFWLEKAEPALENR